MSVQLKWAVFDLDDTLYSAKCGIWLEIRERINAYMVDRLGVSESEVAEKREAYFREYGTSLAGLHREYPDIDTDEYLAYVHDVSYSEYLSRNVELEKNLDRLLMKKCVFTNSDRNHTDRVLSALGVKTHFEIIVDIYATKFINKPRAEAFGVLFEVLRAEPDECVLLDDQERNIKMAHSLGMLTVHVKAVGDPDGIADIGVVNINEGVEWLREISGQ